MFFCFCFYLHINFDPVSFFLWIKVTVGIIFFESLKIFLSIYYKIFIHDFSQSSLIQDYLDFAIKKIVLLSYNSYTIQFTQSVQCRSFYCIYRVVQSSLLSILEYFHLKNTLYPLVVLAVLSSTFIAVRSHQSAFYIDRLAYSGYFI